MIDTIAAFEGRIAKVQGPARSGKTEALVRRCATLIQQGVAPESVLVAVANSFAAQAFTARLAAALGGDEAGCTAAQAVRVCTALDACVEVLDTPAARQATGRVPRLLTTAEYNFFLEDMKTLGSPIRRLRSMLDYFYRQMSACEPVSDWAIGSEEGTVLAHLDRVLTLREAMLVQEAPFRCAGFLQSVAGEAQRGCFAYVLCDDFQNLSHAEQTCLCLLASKQLIVCGNPNQTQATGSAYPYPEGFTRFEAVRRNVEVFTLTGSFAPAAVRAFTDALCDRGDMDTAFKAGGPAPDADEAAEHAGTVEAIKWLDPEDELTGLTKYLRVVLDEKAGEESRTCVLVPNKRWALMVERALTQRGFAVSAAGALGGLSGDPRDSSRARALVAYTKLCLLAEPRSMVAWRSWCGFDNYLTNSDAWNGLQEYAIARGLTLYDALAATADTPDAFLRADELARRFTEGQAFITQNVARTGFSLMHAIGADDLPEFETAAELMEGDENADALLHLVRTCLSAPVWPENPHVIHVTTFDTLCGTSYDNVFAVACVDGFMPTREAFEVVSTEEERERLMNNERRRFCNAVSKANERLMVSYFTKAPLELAERTKMQVARVRAEHGDRVAAVRPTTFLTEAGAASPTTLGGQELLATLNLA